MNNQALKSPTINGNENVSHDSSSNRVSGNALSSYLGNLNRLRDIYIDSSLFRNPVWEVFLSLYSKRQEHLQVTLATLVVSNRLSETDCADAIENLAAAGLVRLVDSETGNGPQTIDLTEQGKQRMEAFLRSAERP